MNSDQAHLPAHLCRRYAAAVLGSSKYLRAGCRRRTQQSVAWLLGWLLDGRFDVLAVWLAASDADSAASSAFEGVRSRGTEFIGVGLGDPFHAEVTFRRLFQPSRVLPSLAQAVGAAEAFVVSRHRPSVATSLREICTAVSDEAARSDFARFERSPLGVASPWVVAQCREFLAKSEATFVLPPELRQMVTSADCATADARARLARAIQRHGPFSDAVAARDFVTAALRRAQRRLDQEHAMQLAAQGTTLSSLVTATRSENGSTAMATLA